jgi:hypothetical protein
VKVEVLMSFRPRLDLFREVAFLLGSPGTLAEHLGLCENPRLKPEGAFIGFDYCMVG